MAMQVTTNLPLLSFGLS
jgi:hypothetical protein